MYEITIITQFSAAHQLRNLKSKCEQLHGHNWKIEVSLTGDQLNEAGLLMDFRDVRVATDKILNELDHSFLNDIPGFKNKNPSSENIAAYIFEKLSDELNTGHIRVAKVTAWESDFANASYCGD